MAVPLRPKPAPQPKITPQAALDAAVKRYDAALADVEAATAAQDFPHKVDISGLHLRTCRFPLWRAEAAYGEPRFYCGARTDNADHPYCPGHMAKTHKPPTRSAA